MTDKLALVWPEIWLFVTTCVVMVVGLSPDLRVRKLCGWISALGLVVAIGAAVPVAHAGGLFPSITPYAKGMIGVVGLMLLPLLAGTVDRDLDAAIESGKATFSALRSNRAEFYAFFLFSLTGLMLTASADDLIWLFLALELTSLPTYIMVTISTRGTRSQEAGVKYFFLGALGAAIFLYGFALIYGATGTTDLAEIAAAFRAQSEAGGLNTIGVAGLAVALIGLCFKIAAVPMHMYAADVYQGAASGVSAMLAFVPKTAGFLAIIMLCGAVGWTHGATHDSLPAPIYILLWVIAAATMFTGNLLAIRQSSVKRILAYSSVAHSGYMLVGVIAGPGSGHGTFWDNGIAAVLFYLLTYGVTNVGTFAVLASIQKPNGEEADDIADIRGLHGTRPHLAGAMLLCVLSLLGMPPLLGFFGKVGLFTSAISAGEIPLVIVLGLNSAIAAFYYLRIARAAYLEPADEHVETRAGPIPQRVFAAVLSASAVVLLLTVAQMLMERSVTASGYHAPHAGMADTPHEALDLTRADD
ncbi:MAG: NADH-quinone oxidoreductase subunit N [Phycisphaeraceae bacterium]|nr:MAG: NADH-quinone oxidoreductase subunit N [Phycisphaeraceae bacterium]